VRIFFYTSCYVIFYFFYALLFFLIYLDLITIHFSLITYVIAIYDLLVIGFLLILMLVLGAYTNEELRRNRQELQKLRQIIEQASLDPQRFL